MPRAVYAEDSRSVRMPTLMYKTLPQPVETFRQKLLRQAWAVADQGLISASNFATMIFVARGLGDPSLFGTFTLVYSAMLFANIFQMALITQPHNVLGAAREGEHYRRYTTSTLFTQLILAGAESIIALAAAAVMASRGWHGTPLLVALAPAIFGWQVQEFFRRVLYTEGRYREVFWNDMLSYGGQMLLIGLMWLHDLRNPGTHWLTGATALYVLAATSVAGALLGLVQIRNSLTTTVKTLSAFKPNWQYGKWLVGSEVLTWTSSIQMYLFLAARVLGTIATADLKSAQVLFGPTRVIAFYLDTVLPIRFARTAATKGPAAILPELRGVLARVALPLCGFCLFVAAFSGPLLRLTFGPRYAAAKTSLMLYSAYALVTYLQMIITAALRAQKNTHLIFFGSAASVIVALPLSLLLIPRMQTAGILVAMIAGALAATVLYMVAVVRSSTPAANFAVIEPALAED
jgi:O-antigen/teichoic acid export membrane protein